MNVETKRPVAGGDDSLTNLVQSLYQRAEAALGQRTNQSAEEFAALSPEAAQRMWHDLEVHQIELEMQNEELRRTQVELETSRADYFDFYDMAPVGYCTLDESGLILQANLSAASMLGVSRDDLSRQALSSFIFDQDQDIFYLLRRRIMQTCESQECELRMVKRDGEQIWVRLQGMAGADKEGVRLLRLVLNNVTQYLRVEKELLAANVEIARQSEEKERRAAELIELSKAKANESVQRYIGELDNAWSDKKRAEVGLRQSESRYRTLIKWTPEPLVVHDGKKIIFANPATVKMLGAASDKELVGKGILELVHPDSRDIVRERLRAAVEQGVRVPLIEEKCLKLDGTPIDVEVQSRPIDFGGESATLISMRDITERKLAEKLIQEQGERLRLLYEASQRLGSTMDLNEIYRVIADFMSTIAPDCDFLVSAFDPDTQLITCRAFVMNRQALDVSAFPPIPLEEEGKGTQSVVIRSGKPLLLNDYQATVKTARTSYFVNDQTHELVEQVDPEEEVIQSALIVPLKVGERVTGVVQVMSCRPNAFSQGQLQLLESLALHIASAKQNAQLYARVQSESNERKVLATTLRESEERYRAAFQASPDAVNINRVADGLYIDINEGFTRLTEWTREDVVGKSSLEIGIWRDQTDRQRLVETLRRDGCCEALEAEFVTKSGKVKAAQMSARIMTIDGAPCILSITRDITQRNQAEAELRESERSLNEAQALAKIGSYVTNIKTGIWQASPTLRQILGIDSSFVTSVENWGRLMAPGYQQKMLDYYQSVVEGGGNFDMDYEVIRPSDGQRRWVHALGRLIYDADGKPIFHKGTIQDITERKLKDERLLENVAEIRLREQALSQISQGVLISDADRRTTYVNDEFVSITGYSREEMLGKPCSILQGTDSQPEVVLQIRAAIDAKKPFHGEILNYRKDGTPFWNQLSINPVFDEASHVTQFVGVLRDVTERKKTLEDLDLFRKCIDRANDVIVITEAEPFELPGPRILFVNDAYERITGYTREEVLGGTPRMLQGPKTDPATIKRMGQALRQWKPVREEVLNYTKEGREFWSEIDIVPMANEAGWYTHWISVQRDITARKLAEEAQRIAAVSFESEQAMFIADPQQVILRINKGFTRITGYTDDEAVGQTPRLLKSGNHGADFYRAMWECVSRTGQWHGEIWNRRKNGTVYPQQLNISTVKDAQGLLTHYVGTFSDITSTKAAEEQIESLAFSDLLTGLP
ncbi:MAG: PAS domain S-box protein, partial [Rhodoferax sp.]